MGIEDLDQLREIAQRASQPVDFVDDHDVDAFGQDNRLRLQIESALSKAGYLVESASDGEQGHYLGDTSDYAAVVLDLGLPKVDGIDVLRKWRSSGRTMPVLVVTARDLWSDKVAGIDAGADDYLAKPFYMAELLARVRALIRRDSGHAKPVLVSGSIQFDTRNSAVTREGVPVILTTYEQRVLHVLMHRAGQVVGRTEIMGHIYANEADRDSNTVEVFIRRLRVKFGEEFIETVRGQGYRVARK